MLFKKLNAKTAKKCAKSRHGIRCVPFRLSLRPLRFAFPRSKGVILVTVVIRIGAACGMPCGADRDSIRLRSRCRGRWGRCGDRLLRRCNGFYAGGGTEYRQAHEITSAFSIGKTRADISCSCGVVVYNYLADEIVIRVVALSRRLCFTWI